MKPIVAVDIDGTIGNYHRAFTEFAELWTGRKMPHPEDINPGLPLHRHLKMSKAYYRQCKLAYRQAGVERWMPVYPGVSDMIRGFRKYGAEVWLCTTRPYLKMDNSNTNTRHFLRRNGIQYDGLIYGPHKYRDLVSQVGRERVIGAIDDLVALVQQAASLGIPAWLRDQPYNRYTQAYPRVMDFTDDPWVKEMTEGIRRWHSHEGMGNRRH